jgi:hypothetical protein
MRHGGTSRLAYHKPDLLRVSQERGMLTSITETCLHRCRRMVCRIAQGERLAACNHTTGSLPLLLAVSRPRRLIDARLCEGVACRNFMAESSRWESGAKRSPVAVGQLDEVPLTKRCQSIDVLAMAVSEKAFAFAR